MNRNGQGMLWAIAVALLIFLAGMLFLNFIKPEVTNTRAADALDCGNISISDGAKLTCLGADIVVPYFIFIILGAAGGYIASRFA